MADLDQFVLENELLLKLNKWPDSPLEPHDVMTSPCSFPPVSAAIQKKAL